MEIRLVGCTGAARFPFELLERLILKAKKNVGFICLTLDETLVGIFEKMEINSTVS